MQILLLISFLCLTVSPGNISNSGSLGSELEVASVAYYSSIPLRESPYPRWRGLVRMNAKQAQSRNHYRFFYDDQFRLIRITFQLGEALKEPNHTANYFFTTPEIRFTYQDNLEIRTFYDRFGNPSTQRGAYKEIYTMDEMGKYQFLHFENEKLERIENTWGIAKYQWNLQPNGAVIEQRFKLNGEPQTLRPSFEFYTIRLCYEENGFLALMQNINEHGQLIENNSGVAQDKLHFDQAGLWYGWTVLDAQNQVKRGNGPNVARGINVPNEWGYESGIRYEDERGEVVKNAYGFWGSLRFYDAYGNYDFTQFIDKDGQSGIHEKAGYSIAQYLWSADGLRQEQVRLLDETKQPVMHESRGYTGFKIEYDKQGRRMKTTYLNLEGKAENRLDNGVAYIEYEYDINNRLMNSKRFDRDGKLLER